VKISALFISSFKKSEVGPRGFEPRTTSAPGLCPDDGILVQAGRLGLTRPHEDGPEIS